MVISLQLLQLNLYKEMQLYIYLYMGTAQVTFKKVETLLRTLHCFSMQDKSPYYNCTCIRNTMYIVFVW